MISQQAAFYYTTSHPDFPELYVGRLLTNDPKPFSPQGFNDDVNDEALALLE
jgi:hypothetical protein